MATLKEDRCYGLSCGRVGYGTNVSVFHVKLTDSALRAFELYQSNKSLSAHPSIQFSAAQGKICIPRSERPCEVQTFTFDLSSLGRDLPQGSFDCVQQFITSDGQAALARLGGVQDKLTVCATDDSYQKARQSLAQAEEETRSRGAIVIKPGGRYPGKKVQVRRPAVGQTDVAPSRRTPRPVLIAGGGAGAGRRAQQRPLRDRISHLLALKPYRKPELLLRLKRDGLSSPEKDTLEPLLQEVAVLNGRDSTFTLKDGLFKELQQDWPGYSEGDQQLLRRVLKRKLCQSQNSLQVPGETPASPPKQRIICSPSPKLLAGDFIDPLANKKQRISHLANKDPGLPSGRVSSSNGKEAGALGGAPAVVMSSGSGHVGSQLPLLVAPRPCALLSDVGDGQEVAERLAPPTSFPGSRAPPPAAPSPTPLLLAPPPQPASLHGRSKKKSKKHRDKEKGREREREGERGRERRRGEERRNERMDCTDGQKNSTDLNGMCSIPTSTSEDTDYLSKYSAIGSPEQRQVYKADFSVEYSEYRDLHGRIEGLTRHFTLLDCELKQLQLGTDKYKTIHNQILQEYRKIKKTHPNYIQERNRCEYLHNKLAYIKRLVWEYDQHRLRPAQQTGLL